MEALEVVVGGLQAVVPSLTVLVAVPVLEEKGIKVLTVADLLASDPVEPVEVGEDVTGACTYSPFGNKPFFFRNRNRKNVLQSNLASSW